MALKTKLFLIAVIFYFYGMNNVTAQNDNFWNGKKCAVVITYDDALNSQLDIAVPLLDSLGLKATFYIPGKAKTLQTRLEEWRKVAEKGHELGNHTLFHPCNGKSKNRKWVKPEYDLDNYTLKRITDEVEVQNVLLHAIDGKTKRTFAFTCGDRIVDSVDFFDYLKKDFVAARGVQRGLNYTDNMDIYNLKIITSAHPETTGKQLIDAVKQAEKEHALAIFLFHGISPDENPTTTAETHRALMEYLSKHEKDIYIAPLVEVIEYYNNNKGQ